MKRYREITAGCEADQSINMAHILMLLSQNGNNSVQSHSVHEEEERVFECKTCNRQFPSFQALVGHRASHKKPKLGSGEISESDLGALAKPKLHECSICGLEFSIGQALGGHMRRHPADN
ncbi:hypothetical protein LUZ60_012982 [Juncus effusus]|nr:hypothetical protein LUZ60_018701 [Juncus effusus]KAJ3668525.1 hypothetical protein LUZ60_017991 [Juncus effusus]KAJ3668526.1 hypothetical protein LUZ60_017992 [Juncus effusus]KAJ3682755.1 hypothetical protein LUZ60_012982 [Juncus effusus]